MFNNMTASLVTQTLKAGTCRRLFTNRSAKSTLEALSASLHTTAQQNPDEQLIKSKDAVSLIKTVDKTFTVDNFLDKGEQAALWTLGCLASSDFKQLSGIVEEQELQRLKQAIEGMQQAKRQWLQIYLSDVNYCEIDKLFKLNEKEEYVTFDLRCKGFHTRCSLLNMSNKRFLANFTFKKNLNVNYVSDVDFSISGVQYSQFLGRIL